MAVVVGFLATMEGRAALDAAKREAALRGERIVVVVSLRPDTPADQRADLDVALEVVRDELTAELIDHEIRVLDGGDVADDLIATAEATDGTLVVIGLRRRSPVGKLVLGGNAQRVLFDSPCPVLTVKPEL